MSQLTAFCAIHLTIDLEIRDQIVSTHRISIVLTADDLEVVDMKHAMMQAWLYKQAKLVKWLHLLFYHYICAPKS